MNFQLLFSRLIQPPSEALKQIVQTLSPFRSWFIKFYFQFFALESFSFTIILVFLSFPRRVTHRSEKRRRM